MWLAALALCLATAAVYHRTFSVPFLFDDFQSIPLNNSIRRLDTALSPPSTLGETVSGRPLLNFSLAINYAISGTRVWSYHALNLLIHMAAGLALFGTMRRAFLLAGGTGRQPAPRERDLPARSLPAAAAVAALWMLHPLQTESVTYIVQRAESLMALWYLLTLYCFVRSASPPGHSTRPAPSREPQSASRAFRVLSVICCALGMASKEVMVSAPVMVLLIDRALVAGSFRAAWARRRGYYCALAATWLLLAWCVASAGNRGGTAGPGSGVTAWSYLLTQAGAIPRYLGLAAWPRGLVFDHGTHTVSSLAAVWPQALLMLALAGATAWLVVKKPAAGLAPFLFFAALAPSSSLVPVATQTMAEHRMYLPLAAVAAAVVSGFWILAGRRAARGGAIAAAAAAVALGAAAFLRNETYRSGLSIWRDTAARAPGNPRAHSNLGKALTDAGFPGEALRHCRLAIELKPDFFEALNNHGHALARLGRYDEAIPYYDKALGLRAAGMEQVFCNRGFALAKLNRPLEALADFEAALRLRPDYVDALGNYGDTLCSLGRLGEALAVLDRALLIEPGHAASWNNRGNVLSRTGLDPAEALRSYKRAFELDRGLWEACDNLARYSLFLGRPDEAIPYYQTAVAMRPGFLRGRHELAVALLNTGRAAESIPHFEAAIRIDPAQALVRHDYAVALARLGRLDEAINEQAAALRIDPGFEQARARMLEYTARRQAK